MGTSTIAKTIPTKQPTLSPQNPTFTNLAQTPLHFPALLAGGACPVSTPKANLIPIYPYAVGTTPVYFQTFSTAMVLHYNKASDFPDAGSSWGGIKIYWGIAPTYRGLVLIRGQELDHPGTMQFNGGVGQTHGNVEGTEPMLSDLRMNIEATPPGQWSQWITFMRFQHDGCYGVQIDGVGFSEDIVFVAKSA